MKEYIVAEWDDYDLLHDGRKVHAPNTVLIGIDGKWRELDLTDENLARLHDMFDPWWVCGRTPDKEIGQGALARKPAVSADREPPAGEGRRGSPERRKYLADLREWAKARDFNFTTKGNNGNSHASYYYPQSLIKAYNEYLEQQELLDKAGAEQEAS